MAASIETWIGDRDKDRIWNNIYWREGGGGWGTLFTEKGQYSPVKIVRGGTLFTGKNCPAGHYSPVNSVRGDTKQGGPNSLRHRHFELVIITTSANTLSNKIISGTKNSWH